MKVAIISDIHDNIWALEKVLTAIAQEKAEAGGSAARVWGLVCSFFLEDGS